MTDWLNDLDEINALFRHPNKFTPDEAAHSLIGILYHVPAHLKAAARLLLDEVPDPFEESLPGERISDNS